MSSPPEFRLSRPSHSSPSQSSASSNQHTPARYQRQQRPEPQPIKLHPYLQSTQEPIAEHIYSHIIWDLREDPLTSAQHVQELGKQLSLELLNVYATEPPVPFLNVVCEYPKPWSIVASASALTIAGGVGGARTRNMSPVYPPATPILAGGTTATIYGYFRSSSALPRQPPTNVVPPIPIISTAPFPGTTNESRAMGITISDLLLTVYNHLHTKSMGFKELDALPNKQRAKLKESFNKRSKMTQGISDGGSVLGSPTSPNSATSPFHFAFPFSPTTTGTTVSPSAMPASTSAPITDIGEVKLVDTLLSHTLFAGMDIVPEKEWTVTLSLKRPH